MFQLLLCLRCLFSFLFLLPFVLIVVVVVVVAFFGFFGGFLEDFFFRFSIYFYYFFYFVLILYFFFVAFILFLYFIYTSGLIQPSFQFQGSKCAITQGIQKVSLLEEDDRCFPSRCGTGVFVCSRVLDIMLAFQDDAGFMVHVFPIHS